MVCRHPALPWILTHTSVLEVITKARVVADSADESSDKEGDRSSSKRKKKKKKKEKEKNVEAKWVSLSLFKLVIETHMNV